MNDTKMKPKLMTLFLLSGLTPLLVVGCWSSQKATAAFIQSSFNQLEEIRGEKKIKMKSFFMSTLMTLRSSQKVPTSTKCTSLPIVWNTTQEHGGLVIVDSSEDGTIFTVYLPAFIEQLEKRIC